MITKLFIGAEREPKLYRIHEDKETFKLRRSRRDREELLYDSPSISTYWRHKALAKGFEEKQNLAIK